MLKNNILAVTAQVARYIYALQIVYSCSAGALLLNSSAQVHVCACSRSFHPPQVYLPPP